jgi:hypothetical protein
MSFRHVLGVLEDDEDRLWTVLDRAVDLAEAECAPLTLAKTSDPGWIVRWLEPFVILSAFLPTVRPDFHAKAGDRLARAAEFVPGSIPITTLILGLDTPCALRALAQTGTYDVVVATAALLARNRLLTRELRRRGICTLGIPCTGDAQHSDRERRGQGEQRGQRV